MVSNSQRSQKQLVFSRVFNKDCSKNSPLQRHLQRKFERMQSMSGGIIKKSFMIRKGSNI